MTTAYSTFLAEKKTVQTKSVQSYLIQGHKVWLKKASKRHSTWIYLPLRWASKLLRLEVLSPIPNFGGDVAIACEIQRLIQLHTQHIRVPQILAQDHDAFLISDAAPPNEQCAELGLTLKKQKTTAQRLDVYRKAIQALQQTHLQRAYLSEAFARNILIDQDQNLTFIDFETDPAAVLNLEQCQSRDWLCFIFSTAAYFNRDELAQASLLITQVLAEHSQSFAEVSRVAGKIQWIAKFKPEKLGKDGLRLIKSIELLGMIQHEYQLNHHKSLSESE